MALNKSFTRSKPDFAAFLVSVAIMFVFTFAFGNTRFKQEADQWKQEHNVQPKKYTEKFLWWEQEKEEIYEVKFSDLGADRVIKWIILPCLLFLIFFPMIGVRVFKFNRFLFQHFKNLFNFEEDDFKIDLEDILKTNVKDGNEDKLKARNEIWKANIRLLLIVTFPFLLISISFLLVAISLGHIYEWLV
jgi:hypothetical protein